LEEIHDLIVDDKPQVRSFCDVAVPILSSTPQVISSKRYREPSAIGLGSGLEPDQASNIRDSPTQREIDGSLEANLPELSLGQRLAAVPENDVDASSGSDIDEPKDTYQKKSKRKAAKANISFIPSNSLTQTLTQALHSSDSRLLEMCLAHTDPKLIRNTIRRLPPQLAIPLINACVERLGRGARGSNMKGRGGGTSSQRGMGLITWINTVLAVHTAHLMTVSVIFNKEILYSKSSHRYRTL
jgi:U3 small nucleolar RNA-associated protein 5